jgi:nitroreductase
VPINRKTIAALVAAGKLAPTQINAMRQEFRLTEVA